MFENKEHRDSIYEIEPSSIGGLWRPLLNHRGGWLHLHGGGWSQAKQALFTRSWARDFSQYSQSYKNLTAAMEKSINQQNQRKTNRPIGRLLGHRHGHDAHYSIKHTYTNTNAYTLYNRIQSPINKTRMSLWLSLYSILQETIVQTYSAWDGLVCDL